MSYYFGKIQLNIIASNTSAFSILDEMKIRRKALDWAAAYLKKKYQLNVEVGPGPERGGDGQSLWQLLKYLWDMKEYLTIIGQLLTWAIRQLKEHIISSQTYSQPTMTVSFDFKAKLDIQDEYSPSMIYGAMSSMSFILEDLRKALSAQYPAIAFDSALSTRTPNRDFSLRWLMGAGQSSVFNMSRINSHIRRLHMRKGMDYVYIITKWGAVKREDSKIVMMEGEGCGIHPCSKFKYLYFFISSKTIRL